MIDLVYFRMHFYYNFLKMFSENIDVFVKNIYICNNTLKSFQIFHKYEMILVQILLNASMDGFRRKIFDL